MTTAVLLGALTGIGVLGVVSALRSSGPSLDAVWVSWQRTPDPRRPAPAARSAVDRLASEAGRRLTDGRWAGSPRVRELLGALAVCDQEPEQFASRLVVIAGACAVGPFVVWFVLSVLGPGLPLLPAVAAACAGPPVAVALAVSALFARARERRRHVRVVLGSFVDLVVLGLAGGVGVDGALHAAAQVTPDWAARRVARALRTARDAGSPPWDALTALGNELGVPELVELSTMVQLAGTEGARIRQALVARGTSLRRHEQAEAESEANAMTERLFLPGAFLLLGFLVFIGYPAVHRILGGF